MEELDRQAEQRTAQMQRWGDNPQEQLDQLATAGATADCADRFAGDIIRKTGPPTRSDPSSPLRT